MMAGLRDTRRVAYLVLMRAGSTVALRVEQREGGWVDTLASEKVESTVRLMGSMDLQTAG